MKVIREKIVKPAQAAVVEQVIEDISDEGLYTLIGKRVTLFCASYFYTGVLVGVNESSVKLEDAGIVYETGPLTDNEWADMQRLPGAWYVRVASIESFGILK